MLFTGYSEHIIDGKLRLAIPAKYRNQWNADVDGSAWMCIPWPSGHLRLYTERYFEAASAAGPATLTPDRDTADLEQRLYSRAERIEMDSAGRIIIPKHHMEWTGLKTDVAVIGARNRLEVHDRAKWNASAIDDFRSMPELVQRVQDKGGRGLG